MPLHFYYFSVVLRLKLKHHHYHIFFIILRFCKRRKKKERKNDSIYFSCLFYFLLLSLHCYEYWDCLMHWMRHLFTYKNVLISLGLVEPQKNTHTISRWKNTSFQRNGVAIVNDFVLFFVWVFTRKEVKKTCLINTLMVNVKLPRLICNNVETLVCST